MILLDQWCQKTKIEKNLKLRLFTLVGQYSLYSREISSRDHTFVITWEFFTNAILALQGPNKSIF